MWKLKLPTHRGIMDHIDTALTLKNGTQKYPLTAANKAAIKVIYTTYDQTKGLAGPGLDASHLHVDLLDALEKGYNEIQLSGRLSKLREKLLLNAKTCPCCGISTPDELDHHLPKSIYKVLAIYSRNLIAYCHKCNNKKRTIDGIDPDKRFIQAYFDEVPLDKQFLFAKVTLRGKSLKIELEISPIPELDSQLQKQMDFMMKKVDLKNRLLKELNSHLSSISTYIKRDYETAGKAGAKKNLETAAKQEAERYGLNHWRHAVIQALANHDAFCDGGFYEPLALKRPISIGLRSRV